MGINCTSCGAEVPAGEKHSRFTCPSCGKEEIVRCAKCKAHSRLYACGCGFSGP